MREDERAIIDAAVADGFMSIDGKIVIFITETTLKELYSITAEQNKSKTGYRY